jgi:deazaflavin-dependent oxidoreductase (nitroreductase family)
LDDLKLERNAVMSQETTLFGEEHVRRYRETNGEEGHIWREGPTVLLLTTKGRKTGRRRTTPLIYVKHEDAYVIVASNGGAPQHTGWYKNLERDPDVEPDLQAVQWAEPNVAQTLESGRRRCLFSSSFLSRRATSHQPPATGDLPRPTVEGWKRRTRLSAVGDLAAWSVKRSRSLWRLLCGD